MAVTDPISDFLTVLRNASRARKEKITVVSSKMLEGICSILKNEGYIADYKVIANGNKKSLRVHLKYQNNAPGITRVNRISKPGLRKYVAAGNIRNILGGFGISVLSTSRGLLTNKEAKTRKVGGEILLEVW
ncbi:MAG: 30S ribosomal protein S8 [Candidatus Omnitrophica bacterium]|nr:30S ribosomal protein S8 [Candidatus Omnitrophota bacterium]